MKKMKTLNWSWPLVVGLTLVGCDAAVASKAEVAADGEAKADAAVEGKAAGKVEAKGEASGEVKAEVVADVKAAGKVELKTEQLDLESVTFLVKKGKVKDAEALEKTINNPKEKLHKIDIDGDGKLDKIQIVEVKNDDGTIVFELHAIPSSSKKAEDGVVVAFITFAPDKESKVLIVKATYAPIVIGYDVVVYDYTTPIVVENDVVVVTGGIGFYGWLFAPRAVYVGVVVWDAPVVVIEGGCWPPGHCKYHGKHKYKFKGKGKHKWH